MHYHRAYLGNVGENQNRDVVSTASSVVFSESTVVFRILVSAKQEVERIGVWLMDACLSSIMCFIADMRRLSIPNSTLTSQMQVKMSQTLTCDRLTCHKC